jgi:hypothetical protein
LLQFVLCGGIKEYSKSAHSSRERAVAKRKNHCYRQEVLALGRVERVAAFKGSE